MEKSKLVSVRLNPEDLRVIDGWSQENFYRTRTDIINACVRLMAQLIKRGQAEKIMEFWPKYDVIDTFDFEYHREAR